tara:strand:- start:30 stop:197 length:168 start_codon:yes stop_codon:yes gene_type:complete
VGVVKILKVYAGERWGREIEGKKCVGGGVPVGVGGDVGGIRQVVVFAALHFLKHW